jgi:hypothetical protein
VKPRLHHGQSRAVLIVGPIAIKLPLPSNRAVGARCNQHEAAVWRQVTSANRRMLCPVLWASASGSVLVMKAARPASEDDRDAIRALRNQWEYSRECEDPLESWPKDWGWLDGRLVAVDYAAPAYVDPRELDG